MDKSVNIVGQGRINALRFWIHSGNKSKVVRDIMTDKDFEKAKLEYESAVQSSKNKLENTTNN